MKTKHLFISHSWKHSNHYERLVLLLEVRRYFDFKDYSVPYYDRLDANTKRAIYNGIKAQMTPCSAVLVVAGVHASRSIWMPVEIEIAKTGFARPKPVIAVIPYGAERASTVATEGADETVRWNTESIVKAIRRHTS